MHKLCEIALAVTGHSESAEYCASFDKFLAMRPALAKRIDDQIAKYEPSLRMTADNIDSAVRELLIGKNPSLPDIISFTEHELGDEYVEDTICLNVIFGYGRMGYLMERHEDDIVTVARRMRRILCEWPMVCFRFRHCDESKRIDIMFALNEENFNLGDHAHLVGSECLL